MTEPIALAAAKAEIRSQVAAAGTSFYWAMRLLPEDRREGMFAVYAFCRAVDDIADSDDKPGQKNVELDRWRAEIDAIFAGTARRPLAQVLADVAQRYTLRRSDFIDIIDGMAMDAQEDIRAPSLGTLDLYCDRVASAVGRLSVRVFGCDLPAADRVAYALGRALQLTNILRDLDEDAARGRLYLPRELLQRHGVQGAAPKVMLRDAGIPAVCEDVAHLADGWFVEAKTAMQDCPRRPMRPAAAMGAVYHAILKRLRARGWTRLDEPVHLPSSLKLWLALRHGLM